MPRAKLFIDADAILSPRPSGIGSMTIELIHALSKDRDFTKEFDIVLIVPFNRIGIVKQWNFNDKVRIKKSLLTGKIVKLLNLMRVLPPLDKVYGKGIYLFTNFRNWPLWRSKSVTYIHDMSFRVYPEYVEKKNLDYLMRNTETWIRRSDVVVTVSDHAKKEIEAYYPDAVGKVQVVPNGITPSFIPVETREVTSVLRKYDLEPGEYFMFLSNIEPRKNIVGLLDAYEEFIAQDGRGDVRLLLVGGMGWNNDDILRRIDRINEKKRMVVKPDWYVPDGELPALLSGAAALIHPAHYEGFGISPLQAMACGTQVVVANNTSLPEVVGKGGIYVDETSTADVLRGMNEAYNRRGELNKEGIDQSKKFTWRSSADKLIEVIKSLESNNDKE